MSSPGKRLFYIAIISIFALTIALPRTIKINNKNYTRPEINISFGNIEIKRDLELKYGLDLVGGSQLTFEAKTEELSASEKENALQSLEEVINQRVNLFGVSEALVQSASFEEKNRIIVELPGVENTADAIDLIGQTAQLIFAELGENEELTPTELTGADIEKAQLGFDQVTAEPIVGIEFTETGSQKFAEITERNIDKVLPIVLDGQVISAPLVHEKITGNQAQISGIGGENGLERARLMATQINAGALPVPVELVSEQTIGPSLGEVSIQKSFEAGLVGVVVVMVFMVLLYGKMGAIADIGLILFGIYTLALYKLIPVVLTLPGIAGFLLSIGMAVDANILIFERFREEKAKDTSDEYALETAFGRAWDSIRDANIATLFTAFILANPFNWSFLHTSGPVRGFAVTLAFGILISLFTGVFISRNLLRFFLIGNKNG